MVYHTSKQPLSNFQSLKTLDFGEGHCEHRFIFIRVNFMGFQTSCMHFSHP